MLRLRGRSCLPCAPYERIEMKRFATLLALLAVLNVVAALVGGLPWGH
jgi:hypothetical protein